MLLDDYKSLKKEALARVLQGQADLIGYWIHDPEEGAKKISNEEFTTAIERETTKSSNVGGRNELAEC